ncbi:N-alpha-acetyltransferase 40 isoform X2 [Belonocnema kinseyi]|uniref:N-alpha-acetyltransferase 40 isoform X2 n=1 Tax=Belonocnema kinseyi TaxID=2817044 RepID=UPI00143D9679|nr:N-alpha-acetyltransferase 40 isoform X2 [Belonocnema kinseyi]
MVNVKKQPRKTRRQQQADRRAVAIKLVNLANGVEQPLPLAFQKFVSKDGTNYEISCSRATSLPAETLSWIFSLMEKNMKRPYQESPWGWDAEKKQAELSDPAALHLVATSNGQNVGFSHFRFDLDDDKEVLYCYELQLESVARRKGLGRFMMHALETMALQNQMQRVVLTVFKNNATAVPFFHALGWLTTDGSASCESRLWMC